MKAIETEYKGHLFRSRLEARWAVFFDALNISWVYENEGYDLGKLGWYLPDFWLPWDTFDHDHGSWVEIKPHGATDEEFQKLYALVEQTRHDGLLFQGQPWATEYTVTAIEGLFCSPPKVSEGLVFEFRPVMPRCGLIRLANDETHLGEPGVICAKDGDLLDAFRAARRERFQKPKGSPPTRLLPQPEEGRWHVIRRGHT
jgi:hypothetical protein